MHPIRGVFLTKFLAHGFCMRWEADVIWLHVVSDGLTALAYGSIAFLLYSIVRKRKDISSGWVLLSFGAFILACSATHVMAIVTLWKPLYRLEGYVKAATALASIVAAIRLRHIIPSLLQIPSPAQLQQSNDELARSHQELEHRVAERTAQLAASNASLQESVEDLVRSETDFRQLADSMPQIVWTAAPDGTLNYYNERWNEFTGFNRGGSGERNWKDLLHPEDSETACGDWQAAVETGLPYEREIRLWKPISESYHWQLARALAIKNREGAVVKWFGTWTDIDDYKKEKNRTDEANRAKSEFLSAMSHEIRTPMNAILGMADLLWESELDVTQRKYVEVFRRAGGNLLTLVNNILDLAKIESKHFELEQIEFDLEELVERTFEMIRPKAQAKRIEMISEVAANTPSVLIGDPTRLQQILINLLGNAVKFTEAGKITLTVRGDDGDAGRVHFDVTDTGIGIESGKVGSVFEDFKQAESFTTRRFGGTGLGLGICRRLVGYMGGELRVVSEAGKGSSFSFDALFQPSAEKPSYYALVNGLGGRRVLVVDDNSTNRLIFAEMCRVWGMECSVCASAGSALTVLRMASQNGEDFDLVILDRFLGQVDGFDLLAQIREIPLDVPVLMASSDSIPGDETRGRQFGIAGYTVKPVRRNELLSLVCKILGEADAEKQKRCNSLEGAAIEQEELRPIRILVAEDSDDNRFLVQEYLKQTPYELTFVDNGQRALEAMQSEAFDLVLMDMQMPVMDGLTATKLIREAERERGLSPIPVLALTANARKEDIESSRAAGCNSHVSKPISKNKLLSVLKEYSCSAEAGKKERAALINVPPGLEAAAKRYIQSRKAEVPLLLEQLADGNFEKVRSAAHNVKGTGTSYGFPDLTRLGALIERSAKERDGSLLSGQLLELSEYIQEAERVILAQELN